MIDLLPIVASVSVMGSVVAGIILGAIFANKSIAYEETQQNMDKEKYELPQVHFLEQMKIMRLAGQVVLVDAVEQLRSGTTVEELLADGFSRHTIELAMKIK